jgi:hypothetical protein
MSGERLHGLDDLQLGRAVCGLDVAWPPTPHVADEVLSDLEQGRPPRRRLRRSTLVVIAAATILVLAAAAALATKLVIDLGGIVIQPVPTVTLPRSPVEPALGQEVSQTEAEAALGTALPVPPALGTPDRIWLQREVTSFGPNEHGTVVAMAWLPEPGLPAIGGTPYGATLFVFEGDSVVALKQADVPITPVGTHDAYWIDAPHELDLLVDGSVRPYRVTGTVLLWQRGPLALRLETALLHHAAVRIAFPRA